MITEYKSDLLEKSLQCIGLFYFVMGSFATYAWASRELDLLSRESESEKFWTSIGGFIGCLNIASVGLIFVSIYKSVRLLPTTGDLRNKVLFFILCIPLSFLALSYTVIHIVSSSKDRQFMSLMKHLGEMFQFFSTTGLVYNTIFKSWILGNIYEKNLIRFIRLIAVVGIFNLFFFHLTKQQVENFVLVASSYPEYSKFYNKTVTDNKYFGVSDFEKYTQSFVILFCCVCMVFLIKFDSSKITVKHQLEKFILSAELTDNEPDDEDPSIDSSIFTSKYLKPKYASFRLSSLSLVLGIMLITVSVLVIAISDALHKSSNFRNTSELLQKCFAIPIYFIAMSLLFFQIKEMKKWSKLLKSKNLVDKTLVWVGSIGQLIIATATIELYYFKNYTNLTVVSVVSEIILIIQTLMQTVTVALALDRKWILPEKNTWQEYLSPSVGLMSINVSLFAYNVYLVAVSSTVGDGPLFLSIFNNGFRTLGCTIAVLQRLHSALMFGKMTMFTNY